MKSRAFLFLGDNIGTKNGIFINVIYIPSIIDTVILGFRNEEFPNGDPGFPTFQIIELVMDASVYARIARFYKLMLKVALPPHKTIEQSLCPAMVYKENRE